MWISIQHDVAPSAAWSGTPATPAGGACTFAADGSVSVEAHRHRPRGGGGAGRARDRCRGSQHRRLRRLPPAVRERPARRPRVRRRRSQRRALHPGEPLPPRAAHLGVGLLRGGGGPAAAQLYLNTANPGLVLGQVTTWPERGSTPYGPCDGTNSTACSWQYGWERARNSVLSFFTPAARAARVDSQPARYVWWLDVETMNTWQFGSVDAPARNRAALREMTEDP